MNAFQSPSAQQITLNRYNTTDTRARILQQFKSFWCGVSTISHWCQWAPEIPQWTSQSELRTVLTIAERIWSPCPLLQVASANYTVGEKMFLTLQWRHQISSEIQLELGDWEAHFPESSNKTALALWCSQWDLNEIVSTGFTKSQQIQHCNIA